MVKEHNMANNSSISDVKGDVGHAVSMECTSPLCMNVHIKFKEWTIFWAETFDVPAYMVALGFPEDMFSF